MLAGNLPIFHVHHFGSNLQLLVGWWIKWILDYMCGTESLVSCYLVVGGITPISPFN